MISIICSCAIWLVLQEMSCNESLGYCRYETPMVMRRAICDCDILHVDVMSDHVRVMRRAIFD